MTLVPNVAIDGELIKILTKALKHLLRIIMKISSHRTSDTGSDEGCCSEHKSRASDTLSVHRRVNHQDTCAGTPPEPHPHTQKAQVQCVGIY
jgi:hypothetical protein